MARRDQVKWGASGRCGLESKTGDALFGQEIPAFQLDAHSNLGFARAPPDKPDVWKGLGLSLESVADPLLIRIPDASHLVESVHDLNLDARAEHRVE